MSLAGFLGAEPSQELDTKATMAVAMLILPDMVRREQLQASASLITP